MSEQTTPELNAIVIQRIEITPGLIVLRVRPEGWQLPGFTPGQFNVLALPASAERCEMSDAEEATFPSPYPKDKLIKRAYSVASSSVEKEYVEYYITLIRSGALTPRLFNLGVGDKLWMSGKFTGLFTLSEVDPGADIVLLATGTGIAPYMSMLRTELEHKTDRRFAVVHGARHSWDLGYHSELVTMARLCKNFSYTPIVSRPEEEPVKWGGEVGYLQDLWAPGSIEATLGFALDASKTHIFLCGNPMMIELMTDKLAAEGFKEHTKKEAGQIHTEKYW